MLPDDEVEVLEDTGGSAPEGGVANFDKRRVGRHEDSISAPREAVLCSGLCTSERSIPMPKGLIILLVMIAVIIIYTIVKIVSYNRLSEQQWKEVDKSKLKEWDDEDPWD